jgi:predicted N-acetyltransferase YhbS
MKIEKIEIKDVTKENVDDLVGLCAPSFEDERHAQTLKEGGLRKHEWIERALERFGVSAMVAYAEGRPVGFVEFYPMSAFPLLPERNRRTLLITCVFVPDKTLQNMGIGSKLVQGLIDKLRHAPMPSFGGRRAEEVAIGSWGCHAGFPDSLPRFRNFFLKNGFKEDPAFPDPTGKGGIMVRRL